jgi:superfamily I DNA/RNA helicase
MGWNVAKEDIMPKSYRCPREILDLGEGLLKECTDYFDRGIQPADHDGSVESSPLVGGLFDEMDPRESWLILARSNSHAKRLASFLDRRGLPWTPTRGNNRWNAPKTRAAVMSLYGLEKHGVMEGHEWPAVLDKVPSKLEGEELLERGTKTRFDHPGALAAVSSRVFRRDEIAELGATPLLIETIASGRWRNVVEESDRFIDSVERYGYEATEKPRIVVSTVHAAKGMEADNVLWLTTTSEQTNRSMQTDDGADAERRVNYVAATRARKRLIVARERCRYAAEVPA